MVENPIYVGNGPVYDSILTQPQCIRLEAQSEQKDTYHCVTNPHYESLPHSEMMADTARYIGQPVQHSLDHCHTSSLTSQSETESIKHPSSKGTSASASVMMGLKSNGQPRNKLGLTLSLGGYDLTHECSLDNAALSKMHGNTVTSSIMHEEEAYAVMNPAGSLFYSFKTGCKKKLTKESTS